jgi:hypothetical protein
MQAVTFPRVVAALAAIVVAGLLLRSRIPEVELPTPAASLETPSADGASAPNATAEDPAAAVEAPAAAKRRELEVMSETFRNTTFLIAIRDAGFVCNELLRVYGGVDGAAKWTATCSEMLAYHVSVASTGELHVEPTMQYWDSIAPSAPLRELREQRAPTRLPPGELLPPQSR